jgi:hypothetical protein
LLDRFRSHLTYANVASTLALVIAVAGGTAYAANTIFSTDIVNGEVKSVDIGTGQVQSADVKNEGLTGTDIANNSLKGADIAEPTLDNIDADRIDGLTVRKINFRVPFGTGPTTVLDLAGLQITAECQGFGDGLDVKAFTSKNDAGVYYTAMSARGVDDTDAFQSIDSDWVEDGFFDAGDQLQIDDASPPFGNDVTGTLHYTASDGSVVVAHLALNENGDEDRCVLSGIAIGG